MTTPQIVALIACLVGMTVNFVTLSGVFIAIGRVLERVRVHGELIAAGNSAQEKIIAQQEKVDDQYLARFSEVEKKFGRVWQKLTEIETILNARRKLR